MPTTSDQTIDTGAYTLTAQDIKALRTCTTIVYRYHRAQEISRLEAIKEADKNNPWEQRRDVQLGTFAESYEEGYRVGSAFGLLRRYSWDTNPLNTFLAVLATGDVLSAHLIAHNNNGYLSEAGLHGDHLRLCIHRGKKTLVFLVEVSVCRDNTARMCQMEYVS